jgi:hypothetical protein
MPYVLATPCTAFAGHHRLATGPLSDVALATKTAADADPATAILVFEDETGLPVHLDLRGSPADVLARLAPPPSPPEPEAPRAGRPKLGVTAREVTLLPRHWEWLADQPGGASAALRRLVDEARKTHAGRDLARKAQQAADRVMHALAGDLPGYEEALRAFYAGDGLAFEARVSAWPHDVRGYVLQLAGHSRTLAALA